MFYAAPSFPRLLDPEVLRETIARGVREGKFGYARKTTAGYENIRFRDPDFCESDVEFSEDVAIVSQDKPAAPMPPSDSKVVSDTSMAVPTHPMAAPPTSEKTAPPLLVSQYRKCAWEGELPPQKWMQFYTRVLTRFATDPSLRLSVRFEVTPEEGIPPILVDEIKTALRELGLDDTLEVKEGG
jgi:hypothetical protein